MASDTDAAAALGGGWCSVGPVDDVFRVPMVMAEKGKLDAR